MILILLALITVIFFIIVDLVPIFVSKRWKLFWIYTIMTALYFIFTVFYGLDYRIPSPAEPIKKLVVTIFGLK